MVRLSLCLACLLLVCLPANAAVLTWGASLDASQEIPPNASTATGTGLVTYDDLTNVLSIWVEWSGLTGVGVQAHIHCCVATPPGNVGIAVDLWLPGDPSRPATGSYSAVFDLDEVNPFRAAFTLANGGTTESAFAALRAAMDAGEGRAYFNIHTAMYPGGEIRGDIARVPEPSMMMLTVAGLGLLALRRRRAARLT